MIAMPGALLDLHDLLDTAVGHSRILADLFFIAFPWSVLGIAITGVGFVAAVCQECPPAFAVRLICVGPALTWGALTLGNTFLRAHSPRAGRRTLLLGVCSACFLLPFACGFGLWSTQLTVVGVQALILVGGLAVAAPAGEGRGAPVCEGAHAGTGEGRGEGRSAPAGLWRWAHPRLLVEKAGKVTSHEHFFSVLVAVGVFSLNERLAETHARAARSERPAFRSGVRL